MNIGKAAAQSGVSAKMIRHYEAIGLLNPANRTASGYRIYNEKDVHTLRFIKQARHLGFPLDLITDLLGLWQNQRRTSRRVKELAQNYLHTIHERIRELKEISNALETLVQHCHGDDRPDCPIIERLATDQSGVGAGESRRNGLNTRTPPYPASPKSKSKK